MHVYIKENELVTVFLKLFHFQNPGLPNHFLIQSSMLFFDTLTYYGKVVMYFLISLVSGFFFPVADTYYVGFNDIAFLILSEGVNGWVLVTFLPQMVLKCFCF